MIKIWPLGQFLPRRSHGMHSHKAVGPVRLTEEDGLDCFHLLSEMTLGRFLCVLTHGFA